MNRWWYGVWTLDDVKKIAGPSGNEVSHEYIISNVAKHFIEGYSSIANINSTADDSQKTQQSQSQADSHDLGSHLGPFLRIDTQTDVHTVTIPLSPLSPTHAASRGNQVLWAIISQVAANQEAYLFPWLKPKEAEGGIGVGSKSRVSPAKGSDDSRKAELEKQVQYLTGELKKHEKDTVVSPPKVRPGRSLGNPTKKARTVQALVYDDDSEEEEPIKAKKRKTKG
ncbi:hypothetical protein M408DRAFT_24319 [Serendipita vermifera MAFF 305830]|uniref:Uncharacterized protein n=1 Tax=Serendipita vermifera MAFF 305830 TaxID=933852 RepID=A0A0C3B6A1_SERVB|nr:hypothetical protein M408DRAFT_24319 [Serendipita vermifera MAFF 305830]